MGCASGKGRMQGRILERGSLVEEIESLSNPPTLAVGRELAFLGIEVGDAGEHTTLVTSGTLVCVGDVMDELCPVVQCWWRDVEFSVELVPTFWRRKKLWSTPLPPFRRCWAMPRQGTCTTVADKDDDDDDDDDDDQDSGPESFVFDPVDEELNGGKN